MEKDLEILNQKLDYITGQLEKTAKRQREMEELQKDLTPVASDMYKSMVHELDQLSPYFTYEDLLFLLKKMMRNTRNITALFEQMESASDFIKDALPISKPLFQSTLETMDTMERKGYFTFLKTLGRIMDKLVTSFSEEELDHLAGNMDAVIKILKMPAAADLSAKVNQSFQQYENVKQSPDKVSWFKILKTMNNAQIRKEIYAIVTSLTVLTNNSKTDIRR